MSDPNRKLVPEKNQSTLTLLILLGRVPKVGALGDAGSSYRRCFTTVAYIKNIVKRKGITMPAWTQVVENVGASSRKKSIDTDSFGSVFSHSQTTQA